MGTGGRWGTGAALVSVVPRPPGTVMPTLPLSLRPFPWHEVTQAHGKGMAYFSQRSRFKVKGQTAGTVHIEKKGARSGHGQVGTGRVMATSDTLCVGVGG